MFSNIKKIAIPLLIAIFFVSIDRFLKILAMEHYQDEQVKIVGDYLSFSFAKNYNIAFSLPVGDLIINILIPIIILFLLLYILFSLKKKMYHEAGPLTIILFGAISNYMDRLRFGFVVDYIDLKYFTVFNVADAMIVVSVIVLIILNYKINEFRGKY